MAIREKALAPTHPDVARCDRAVALGKKGGLNLEYASIRAAGPFAVGR